MQPTRQNKRKGRQLLVAAVGIASVSYVGTIQGCADTGPEEELGEGSLAAEQAPEDVAGSSQALNATQAVDSRAISAQAAISNKIFKWGGLPGSGNLMPTPGGTTTGGIPGGGVIVIDGPIPVGNLMVTPVDQVAIDQATIEALEAVTGQR